MKAFCTSTALAVIVMSEVARADSATHCKSGETDFFSCSIANSRKVVSLCGNREEETNELSWLQYRFGVIGRPELVYPASKDASLNKFYVGGGQSNEGRYQEHYIWFRIGAYIYTVSTAAFGEGKTEFSASVAYDRITTSAAGRRVLEHGELSCSQPSLKLMDGLGVFRGEIPYQEPDIEVDEVRGPK
jgi:hypothetical protein